MINGNWHSHGVLVLRTDDMEKLKTFFEYLGLKFKEEKHGNGPTHFACEVGSVVLEVYPPSKSQEAELKSRREIGTEYLEALSDAKDARKKVETNDGDSYDPCGDVERRVATEFSAAIERLTAATKALIQE